MPAAISCGSVIRWERRVLCLTFENVLIFLVETAFNFSIYPSHETDSFLIRYPTASSQPFRLTSSTLSPGSSKAKATIANAWFPPAVTITCKRRRRRQQARQNERSRFEVSGMSTPPQETKHANTHTKNNKQDHSGSQRDGWHAHLLPAHVEAVLCLKLLHQRVA